MYIANLLVNHRASRTTYNNIRKKKLVTYGNTVVLFLKTIRYMFSLPTKLLCKHNLSCNGKAPNTLMVIVTRYFGKKIYIYTYIHIPGGGTGVIVLHIAQQTLVAPLG